MTKEGKATHLIEVKLSDDSIAPALRLFARKTPQKELETARARMAEYQRR